MNLLRYVSTVSWSFLGIRRRAAANKQASSLRALPLVITAIVAVLLFVGLLLMLATLAIHWL